MTAVTDLQLLLGIFAYSCDVMLRNDVLQAPEERAAVTPCVC